MRPRALFDHAIIAGYLLMTAAALLYTLSLRTVEVPLLPQFLVYWSYGMMAPYQGDDLWNSALVVQGKKQGGAWAPVSLDRYMPYGAGERNAREFFRVFTARGPQAQRDALQQFLLQLQRHERERGSAYISLRAYWDTWPRSPGGFEFLHQPLFTTRQLITQIQ